MRQGALLVTSARVNQLNMNYIVKKLNACSFNHVLCDACPDLEVCVKAYDDRCSSGDTICRVCGEEVPVKEYCANCGAKLSKRRKDVKTQSEYPT